MVYTLIINFSWSFVGRVFGCLAITFFAVVMLTHTYEELVETSRFFHLVAAVDLFFHEGGHFATRFLSSNTPNAGSLIYAAAGSVTQCLVPLGFSLYFVWNKQYLSAIALLPWLAENLFSAGIYIADATSMQLSLIFDNATHDWNYVLGNLGWLPWDHAIGNTLITGGKIILVLSIILAWITLLPIQKAMAPEEEAI